MELKSLPIDEIKPYENNPRNNDNAVDAVAESIKQCTYIQPIVIDENGVILAGHTRYKALKKLGFKNANVIIAKGLTEEQKKKYRYLDNKTGEAAEWDILKLTEELERLDLGELDFFNIEGETFEVSYNLPGAGAKEYGEEAFADGGFKYECEHCGFKFN